MPQKHWSILSYQVVSTTATAFFTVPQTLLWGDFICPQRGCQADLEQGEIRPYHSCIEGPTPLASHSPADWIQDRGLRPQRRPWARSDLPQPHCNLSGRLTPELICGLLYGATWLCLEPRPVASGPGVSVSPDLLFGTHCPRALEFRNCRWNVSNLCWKHIYFAKHMPSSAHSAFVTWLGGA